mmetsp:Transcript_72593/g.192833  ORF Transcript_72593/g.192833 Transcript_72593/m.192833 type:complete len:484 (+) Transcript_72593:398-1849(+)
MPAGDAAKDQNILNLVVLRVLSQGVSQVDPDGLVDLAGLRLLLRVFHGRLDVLEAARMWLVLHRVHGVALRPKAVWHIDAALDSKARCRALAQVHVRDPAVGRPRVIRRVRVEVQGHVAELVDPTHQVAVDVAVPSALAATHGNAHEVAALHHHHAGKCGDLPVVDDLQRHIAKFLGKVVENRHDLLLVDLGRHVGEDVAPSGLVLARDGARGAAADGVDPGQVGGGLLHRTQDHVPVVLRVRVGDVPLRLLRGQDLVVLHGHGLDVALPQVERQAAAVGVLAADLRGVPRQGQLPGAGHDLHAEGLRPAADLGHGRRLERELPSRGELPLEVLAHRRRPADEQLVGAALPDQLLYAGADDVHGCRDLIVAFREDWHPPARAAVGPNQGPVHELRGVPERLQVAELPEDVGCEVGVERRGDLRLDEQEPLGRLAHRRVRRSVRGPDVDASCRHRAWRAVPERSWTGRAEGLLTGEAAPWAGAA